ncbi:MAG: prepilin-type N-terminal cleavage/methylation domain-containing protein [Methylobacter sp.]
MNGKNQAAKPRVAKFSHTAGFTLIEVLIAMTLLSMMVVLLFASLTICAQSWERGENKIADVNEVAVVQHFFQQHLASAIPVTNDFMAGNDVNAVDRQGTATDAANGTNQQGTGTQPGNNSKNFSFQGKKDSLQFVSVFPASVGRAGMQLFSIQPQRQGKDQVIKVTLMPFFPVTEGEEWNKEEEVLLKHVGDFSLSYFGAADDTGKSSWQDEWLGKNVQPKLVKIGIQTTDGVYWPEMIIELKVANAGTGVNAAPAGLGGGN